MKTLEKMIRKAVDNAGFILNTYEIRLKDAAEYIEMMNMDNNADLYTPEDWVRDTVENYPNYFIKKSDISKLKNWYCNEALYYMIKQRELCFDQTGMEPNLEDYSLGMDSEGFSNYMKSVGCDLRTYKLTLDDIFDYLVMYWNEN